MAPGIRGTPPWRCISGTRRVVEATADGTSIWMHLTRRLGRVLIHAHDGIDLWGVGFGVTHGELQDVPKCVRQDGCGIGQGLTSRRRGLRGTARPRPCPASLIRLARPTTPAGNGQDADLNAAAAQIIAAVSDNTPPRPPRT